MNLFSIHPSPLHAANGLCDQHINKMILETAQILDGGTRHILTNFYGGVAEDYEIVRIPWTQRDNPVIVSARSREVFEYAYEHFGALLCEFHNRYGHTHSYEGAVCDALMRRSTAVLPYLRTDIPKPFRIAVERPPSGLYGSLLDAVSAHRVNYVSKTAFGKKPRRPSTWTKRPPPDYLQDLMAHLGRPMRQDTAGRYYFPLEETA